MSGRQPRAILFDLDGTLVDTAPDLAWALNATLQHYDRQPLPYASIRSQVSHGGIALIRLGFGIDTDDPAFETYRQHLLKIYRENISQHSQLFAGMDSLLEYLEQHDIAWGIVTNKPAWLTDPLLEQMQLQQRVGCVVSGDTCAEKKPHPMPVQHACQLLQVEPADTWYVGDAQRDIEAGRAAGCFTIAALFGYIEEDDCVDLWQADLQVSHATDIITLIEAAEHNRDVGQTG